MGHNREPLVSNLVKCVAQDWIAARLHSREQPLQASLLPVNHSGGSRVSVPAPWTTSQDVAVVGSLRVISANAQALEEHTLRSLTGTATTVEGHGILSVLVLWCFTFMVSVGVVGHFLETCVAFTIMCLYYSHSPC